jgi:hypothetical protein
VTFVVRAASAVGVAVSLWLLVVVVQHAGRAVYDLPKGAVVAGIVGALASITGWALIARSDDGGVLLLSALLGVLLVGGVAALLSIGILLLLIGGGVSVVLGRVAGRRRAEGRPVSMRAAVAVAALVGFGLPIAALAAADGPVVRCLDDGVATSSSVFRQGSSGSGSSSSGGDGSMPPLEPGEHMGAFGNGSRSYRYRCVGRELVEFYAFDT